MPDSKNKMTAQFQFGQWTLRFMADGGYEFVNLDLDGKSRYYRVVPGRFNQPLIDQEPNELALPVPRTLKYQRFDKGKVTEPTSDDKIIGIVCRNGPRFSMTNAKDKGVSIRVNPDDSIQVGNKAWWILLLLCPDAQRFTPNRWVAYLVPNMPKFVFVGEMADLLRDWDARIPEPSAK